MNSQSSVDSQQFQHLDKSSCPHSASRVNSCHSHSSQTQRTVEQFSSSSSSRGQFTLF